MRENLYREEFNACLSDAACERIAKINGLTQSQYIACHEMDNGQNRYRCCDCPFYVPDNFRRAEE